MNRLKLYGLTSLLTAASAVSIGQYVQKNYEEKKAPSVMKIETINECVTHLPNEEKGIYRDNFESRPLVVAYARDLTVGGYGDIEKTAVALRDALTLQEKKVSVWFEDNGFVINGDDAQFTYRTPGPFMTSEGTSGSIYIAKEEMTKEKAKFYDYDGDGMIDGFDLLAVDDSSQYRPVQDVATKLKDDLGVAIVKNYYLKMK